MLFLFSALGGIAATIASFGAATPLVGLGWATLGGALTGLASGVIGNLSMQVQQNGLSNVNFGGAWVAGGISALVGAATGAFSFGVGIIAKEVGGKLGLFLSNMSISGQKVSKLFSVDFMINIVGKISSVVGSAVASYFGDYMGKHLFNQSYTNENAQETTGNIILNWLLEFVDGYLKSKGVDFLVEEKPLLNVQDIDAAISIGQVYSGKIWSRIFFGGFNCKRVFVLSSNNMYYL